MKDIPKRLRVMDGVTIEDGYVKNYSFGEMFSSDPDKAFGPWYVHEDSVRAMAEAIVSNWLVESENGRVSYCLYCGVHQDDGDACHVDHCVVSLAEKMVKGV